MTPRTATQRTCAPRSAETVVERPRLALVCSAVSAHQRIVADRSTSSQRADDESVRIFEWLGAVGERIEVTGTVRTRMVVDGYVPGSTRMLIVVDNGIGLCKAYTAAAWAYDDAVRVGATVRVTATVKAHEMYRSDKQTVLVRAKGTVVPVDD